MNYESKTIQFNVYGDPKAQPRMKAYSRGKHAGVYDPGTADDWKSLIVLEARKHAPEAPFEGPVVVDLSFHFKRPKRLLRKKDKEGVIPHVSKPDRDNLDKAVLDSLSHCGFWKDDCQVYAGSIQKWYAPKGEPSGVSITITPTDRGR